MNTLKDGLYDAYLILLASQQSHITALLSVLDNRLEADDTNELIETIFSKVVLEFHTYFRSEEELMSIFLYDKIKRETEVHSWFISKLKEIEHEFKENKNKKCLTQELENIHKSFDNDIASIEEVVEKISDSLENFQDKFADGREMNVRVSIFDIQHRNIDFLLESIICNIDSENSKEIKLSLIDDLISKFKIHFLLEEDLMLKHNFPELVKHKKEHDQFLELLESYEKKYKENTLLASASSTFEILKVEVDNHIINTDKQYTDFFNKLGIL